MHFFALLLFVSFGVVALTHLGERGYRRLREGRAFVAAAWGIGLAWLANINLWTGWNIAHLRYAWVGVTLTGLAIGGAALISPALLGLFSASTANSTIKPNRSSTASCVGSPSTSDIATAMALDIREPDMRSRFSSKSRAI